MLQRVWNCWSDNRNTSIYSGAGKSEFFEDKLFRVMSTPFSYSKGSGLYLAAMYTQNKLKLIKCSIWRPDKPKISTFTGADLKKVNFWNRKLFVRSNRSRILHRIWFYPTAIYPRNKINLVRCSIWRSDDPKTSIFSGADICHFLEEFFLCNTTIPRNSTGPALSSSAIYSSNRKTYLGSPIVDRISQNLQFIVEPEYHNFSRTNILRASLPPSSYSIDSALSSSNIDSVFSTEKNTHVAFADLITQRYLLSLDLTWGRTNFGRIFFVGFNRFPGIP